MVLPSFFSGGCAYGLGLYLSWPSRIYFSMVWVFISSEESSSWLSSSSLSSYSSGSSSSYSSACCFAKAALCSSSFLFWAAAFFSFSAYCFLRLFSASFYLFFFIYACSFFLASSSCCYCFFEISSLCFCKSASFLPPFFPLVAGGAAFWTGSGSLSIFLAAALPWAFFGWAVSFFF